MNTADAGRRSPSMAAAVRPSACLMLASDQSWAGTPLPLALEPLGFGAGCRLFVDIVASDFFAIDTWSVPIPNQPGWLGITFFLQTAVVDATASLGLRVTNALRGVIGSR